MIIPALLNDGIVITQPLSGSTNPRQKSMYRRQRCGHWIKTVSEQTLLGGGWVQVRDNPQGYCRFCGYAGDLANNEETARVFATEAAKYEPGASQRAARKPETVGELYDDAVALVQEARTAAAPPAAVHSPVPAQPIDYNALLMERVTAVDWLWKGVGTELEALLRVVKAQREQGGEATPPAAPVPTEPTWRERAKVLSTEALSLAVWGLFSKLRATPGGNKLPTVSWAVPRNLTNTGGQWATVESWDAWVVFTTYARRDALEEAYVDLSRRYAAQERIAEERGRGR